MRRVYDRRVPAAPWEEVFDLMWEAYSAGTIPVGAVIVDESGAIVARGRNRIFGDSAGGELGRSRLAHAEINALLALPSGRTYRGWTLYSALEPCHLCLAAAHSARVGTVRFAGKDRYGGATGKLVPSADHTAHPVAVEGPLPGEAGSLPELLLVAFFLWHRPGGDVVRFFEEHDPELVVRARGLEPPGGSRPTGT
jgi:tRNA(adenine34) deaminase